MKTKALKVGMLSLGCPRNLVDSENILGRLSMKNFSIVDLDKADTVIVNTCAFIEEARQESVDAILDLAQLKKSGKLKRIIVHGCLAQRYKDLLRKELPEVDAFVGRVSMNHTSARYPIAPAHYSYLKICESCLNNCSYCVIPKIKGKFESLEADAILRQVKDFEARGVAELDIIGQDISGYGSDLEGNHGLVKLISEIVSQAKHVKWIRLLYLYPTRISDELLELIDREPRLCKYIDLPIQHINSRILKLMNRKTGREDILKVIKRIRGMAGEAAIRTSLIVGFPSETDDEFKELLDFVRVAKFERLGAFIYSREEGTMAYDLKGQVVRKVKQERFDQVMAVQQEISRSLNDKLLGKTIDVMIDEARDGRYLGRTQHDAPEVDGQVYVSSARRLRPGEIIKMKVTDTMEYDLAGEAQR
ncbi:MiaB/RimO family radical SAM methylthiotransferase [Candidatus Omnitrophota bacterium]